MESPLVSILIPVFNTAPYLRECLDSVIAQTYKNLEIICINDGSSDGSEGILREYAENDSRIRVYTQQNVGVGATRNRLLDNSSGIYILFVDSDDSIHPECIEKLLAIQVATGAEMVVSGTPVKGAGDRIEIWNDKEAIREFIRHEHLNGMLWNKLISAELCRNIRFDPEISYGEDALFIWQVLQRVDHMAVTDERLYNHRVVETGLSASSFGEKKISSRKVWSRIASDAASEWPEFSLEAAANFAVCDFWLLYFAAKDNYHSDKMIKEFQKHLRHNLTLIRKTRLLKGKKLFFASLIAFNYPLSRFLLKHLN